MNSRVATADDVAHPTPRPVDVSDPTTHRLPARFRIGRWFLLAEGVLVAELAGITVAGHGVQSAYGSTGFTLCGLMLTPVRSGLLFAFGVVAVVATLNRRSTMVVTAAALAISLALTAIADTALATGVSRQWGIDPHNAGLYALLVIYDFALLTWLIPDLWERRDPTEFEQRDRQEALQEK